MSKTIIVDNRCYKESADTLYKLGYNIISVPCQNYLQNPVSAHPDMLMVKLNDTWFVSGAVHNLITFTDDIILCGREDTCEILQYPNDVYMNCAIVGKRLICNKKYTHNKILAYAEKCGYEIINVRQGYAKCSICIVDDNSIITEDIGIAQTLLNYGLDVLLIKKGEVKLDGYDYGFIGGCCGLIEKNILAFNGNLENHPDYDKISDFCTKRGVKTISLCEKPLYDIGSILGDEQCIM